jgi:hypothetical protein
MLEAEVHVEIVRQYNFQEGLEQQGKVKNCRQYPYFQSTSQDGWRFQNFLIC